MALQLVARIKSRGERDSEVRDLHGRPNDRNHHIKLPFAARNVMKLTQVKATAARNALRGLREAAVAYEDPARGSHVCQQPGEGIRIVDTHLSAPIFAVDYAQRVGVRVSYEHVYLAGAATFLAPDASIVLDNAARRQVTVNFGRELFEVEPSLRRFFYHRL